MTLHVTITNVETGDTETTEVPEGDYLLICHDPCRLHHVQKYPSTRTHVLTIKGHQDPNPTDKLVATPQKRFDGF